MARRAATCITWHANGAPQEVAQRREAPRCSSWLEPRVCGPERLAQDHSFGTGAVAMLIQQHHRSPEDGSLEVI